MLSTAEARGQSEFIALITMANTTWALLVCMRGAGTIKAGRRFWVLRSVKGTKPEPVKTLGKSLASQVSEGSIVSCAGPVLKVGLKPVHGHESKRRDNLHP